MEKRLIELSVNEIYEECLNSCIEFCGIQKDTVRGKRVLEKCLEARERFCKECKITILISPFTGKCVMDDSFRIESKTICCSGLKELLPSDVIGGYLYAVFTGTIQLDEMSTLLKYYADCWMSAYADAGWKSLKAILVNEAKKDFCSGNINDKIVISESFAPGFNGMMLNSTGDLFQLMKLSEYGLELYDNSFIKPQKSIIGIYLAGY